MNNGMYNTFRNLMYLENSDRDKSKTMNVCSVHQKDSTKLYICLLSFKPLMHTVNLQTPIIFFKRQLCITQIVHRSYLTIIGPR